MRDEIAKLVPTPDVQWKLRFNGGTAKYVLINVGTLVAYDVTIEPVDSEVRFQSRGERRQLHPGEELAFSATPTMEQSRELIIRWKVDPMSVDPLVTTRELPPR